MAWALRLCQLRAWRLFTARQPTRSPGSVRTLTLLNGLLGRIWQIPPLGNARLSQLSNSFTTSSFSITIALNGLRLHAGPADAPAPDAPAPGRDDDSARPLSLPPLNLLASLRARQVEENGDAAARPPASWTALGHPSVTA